MTVAAIAPDRIAAAILNDVGPELSKAGLDRIRSYVGKNVRFCSWDEARSDRANNNHIPTSSNPRRLGADGAACCREKEWRGRLRL